MPRGGAAGVTTVDVVVTYLELDLVPAQPSAPVLEHAAPSGRAQRTAPLKIDRVPRADAPGVAALMYRAVGGPWHWTDRLGWSDAEWTAAVDREDVEVWAVRVDHEIAGYFELDVEADAVELKYFGLMPEFTGRRIGGALLSAAVARAGAIGKARMTVNTCTLDHPSALPNYLKHGFVVSRTETQRRSIPA